MIASLSFATLLNKIPSHFQLRRNRVEIIQIEQWFEIQFAVQCYLEPGLIGQSRVIGVLLPADRHHQILGILFRRYREYWQR